MAREASQENRAIHYIPELDGLRGIAIVLVVLSHARPDAARFAPLPFLHTVLDFGTTGVDLFFVLSGFLITSILLSTRDAPPRSYFWSFYARRVLRIFPLYFLAVATYFHHKRWEHTQEEMQLYRSDPYPHDVVNGLRLLSAYRSARRPW
ncbi:MAG: acyltransferase [Terriglobales bacterium]